MINQEIEMIKNSFNNYFSDKNYFIILLIALVIIFIEEKRKENKDFLILYPIFIFVVIINPIFAKIMLKFITASVYYRFFWAIPVGIIIAYFATILLSKVEKKIPETIVALALIGIIIFSGNFVYIKNVFKKVDNLYKMPDEYVEVIKLIGESPIQNKKVITSTEMIGYIRQIDASIKLAYQRRPYEDYHIFPVVNYYNAGEISKLTDLCKKEKTNIIVFKRQIPINGNFNDFGFDLYAQTENYDIYVLAQ